MHPDRLRWAARVVRLRVMSPGLTSSISPDGVLMDSRRVGSNRRAGIASLEVGREGAGRVDLVLWPRPDRTLLVLAGVYLGVPVAVFVAAALVMSIRTGGTDWFAEMSTSSLLHPLVLHALLAHVLVLGWMGSPCGPLLFATKHGMWIRARRWPTRMIYLRWSSTTRITHRRWLFDHVICVHADIGADRFSSPLARVDVGLQRALFGTSLTASTFWSGQRPVEVMTALRRLCGGTAVIETVEP